MPTSMASMSTIETPIVEESTTMESVMDSTMIFSGESLTPMDTSQDTSGLLGLGGLGQPEREFINNNNNNNNNIGLAVLGVLFITF